MEKFSSWLLPKETRTGSSPFTEGEGEYLPPKRSQDAERRLMRV